MLGRVGARRDFRTDRGAFTQAVRSAPSSPFGIAIFRIVKDQSRGLSPLVIKHLYITNVSYPTAKNCRDSCCPFGTALAAVVACSQPGDNTLASYADHH